MIRFSFSWKAATGDLLEFCNIYIINQRTAVHLNYYEEEPAIRISLLAASLKVQHHVHIIHLIYPRSPVATEQQ